MPKEEPSSSDDTDWKESILSLLKKEQEGGDDEETRTQVQVKKLRKKVLKVMDVPKKAGKKSFKKRIKVLEEEEILTIDADGMITLLRKKDKKEKTKKRKKKDNKKEEKKKKKKRRTSKEGEEEVGDQAEDGEKNEEIPEKEEEEEEEDENSDKQTRNDDSANHKKSQKGIPCDGNPGGVTRLFLGNLPFAVDENSLSEFLPHEVTHIKWITDKTTGKFYGSAFIEMDTPSAAAEATAMTGSKLMGRNIKINYAPARPGDVWPPANKVVLGGGAGEGGGSSSTTTTGGSAGGRGAKAMGEKPENCVKLFMGNLSYDIDDETITKFFDNVGAEVKAVRWLSHRDTGDFKGCGFVEFWNTDACDKAATLNGKNLLGRPIRIDWTD